MGKKGSHGLWDPHVAEDSIAAINTTGCIQNGNRCFITVDYHHPLLSKPARQRPNHVFHSEGPKCIATPPRFNLLYI